MPTTASVAQQFPGAERIMPPQATHTLSNPVPEPAIQASHAPERMAQPAPSIHRMGERPAQASQVPIQPPPVELSSTTTNLDLPAFLRRRPRLAN